MCQNSPPLDPHHIGTLHANICKFKSLECNFKQIGFMLSINIKKNNSNIHMHFEKIVAKVVSVGFEHVPN
jgi:hypothetical protein